MAELMDIFKILAASNRKYSELGAGEFQTLPDLSELVCYGRTKGGKVAALAFVGTAQPTGEIGIQESDGERKVGALTEGAISELASAMIHHEGHAAILWLNAGLPGMIQGAAVRNLISQMEVADRRREEFNAVPPRSLVLKWERFTPIPIIKDGNQALLDWLQFAREGPGYAGQSHTEAPASPESEQNQGSGPGSGSGAPESSSSDGTV